MAMQPAIADTQIASLLPACQRGDSAAIEAVYDLYADRLYRYILVRVGDSDAAADLTTELFVRVIKHVSGFRLNQQRPAASFSAWIYRIAANLISDYHRTQKRNTELSLTDNLMLTALEPGPVHQAERMETFASLGHAINKLSDEQRLVILAKFGEDMSNAEVARWLGKSEGAVKSLQHRALEALGRLLAAGER